MTDSPPAPCTLCPEPRADHRPLLPKDGAARARCATCSEIGRPHARLDDDARGEIIYLCPRRHHTVAAIRYDK